MIRWLGKEYRGDRETPYEKKRQATSGRCILDCSISLSLKVRDSGAHDNLKEDPKPTTHMNAFREQKTGPADDETLVAKTLQGDKEAYRVLVERYQNRLLTAITEILKSREDAEDVVQESFVKAFLSLRNFKQESSFYTWLYRITYNMAIDVRRKAVRRGGTHVEYREGGSVNKVSAEAGAGSVLASVPADHLQNVEGPHAALLRKETGHRLRQVLAELSEEHRAVIMLREVDGLNYDEIAQAVGVPRGTVMSRLHYARKALQRALRDFVGQDHDPSNTVGMEHEGSEEDKVIPPTIKAVRGQ